MPALTTYPSATAAHAAGWNRKALTDTDPGYGFTTTIHHEQGCSGQRTVPAQLGWRPIPATLEDVAADGAYLCDTCRSMLETAARKVRQARIANPWMAPAVRSQDEAFLQRSKQARAARRRERRAATT
jgi:hypothetical protein